jgi:DNA mismatch endonuclease, patch repair protein
MPARKSAPSVPRYDNYRPRSTAASRVGASNRRQDTTPEILLRAALRAAGIGYRSNVKTLPGCPDFVLTRYNIAVFCDGDFWHGRRWAERKRALAGGWNATYWVSKIERNRTRDRSVTRALKQLGWQVICVWEQDLRRDPQRVAATILELIHSAPSRDSLRPRRS